MTMSEDLIGLKMEPIKHVVDLLSPCLTHIYNLYFKNGIFPQNMKNAKVEIKQKWTKKRFN